MDHVYSRCQRGATRFLLVVSTGRPRFQFKRKRGPWEFHLEGILGNNGDQVNANREGDFLGYCCYALILDR